MTNSKWVYVAKGHYSKPDGSGGTIHVVGKSVYVTHPKRATRDITGAEAAKHIASVTGKPAEKPGKKGKKPVKNGVKRAVKKVKSVAKTAKAVGRTVSIAAAPTISIGRAVARGGAAVIAETRAASPGHMVGIEEFMGVSQPPKPKAKKKAAEKKTAKKAVREAVIVDGEVYYRAVKAKKPAKKKKARAPPLSPRPQTIEEYLAF